MKSSAIEKLKSAGVPSPEHDVRALLMYVLDTSSAGIITTQPTEEQEEQFAQLVERRANREPLQHILGSTGFRRIELHVGPGVFVPRPETEVLVELALSQLESAIECAPTTPLGTVPTTIVDLCSGSGAIALSLAVEAPDLQPTAIDLSILAVEADQDAIEWTRRNALLIANDFPFSAPVNVVHADARDVANESLARLRGQVAMVTCNPPYIPDDAIPRDLEVRDYDPAIALYGGPDGLDIVREIVDSAAALLYPGGHLLIEHGDEQGEGGGEHGVPHVVRSSGLFSQVEDHLDHTDRPRATTAIRI